MSAYIDKTGTFRYWLKRDVGDGPPLGWLMLNPSTADASLDDPTIRRVIGFTRAWGYGQAWVTNLFALRATDPAELNRHDEPRGPENEAHVLLMAVACPVVVCAWGATVDKVRHRWIDVAAIVERNSLAMCLGSTKAGYPRHPLYVRADTELVGFGVST
jgi:hypothetical protein